jgi:hypothetical protein
MTKPKATFVKCCVDGCPNMGHAKKYCMKHYGQMWRNGRIRNETKAQRMEPDKVKALERKLQYATRMYDAVVGFAGHIRWRREIEKVKYDLSRLKGAGV